MSIKIMTAVFAITLPPSEKVVALALADHAHDDGTEARPGKTSLAIKCSLSERQVQRVLKILVTKGVISVQREATSTDPVCYQFFNRGDNLSPDNLSPNRETHVSPKSTELDMRKRKSLEDRAGVIYDTYPRKQDRAKAVAKIVALLRKGERDQDLLDAVAAYAATKIDSETKFIKLAATFFNESWREWVAAAPRDAKTVSQTAREANAAILAEQKQRHEESVAMPNNVKESLKRLRGNL